MFLVPRRSHAHAPADVALVLLRVLLLQALSDQLVPGLAVELPLVLGRLVLVELLRGGVGRKVQERLPRVRLELVVQHVGALLALAQDDVEVGLGDVLVAGLEDVAGAELDHLQQLLLVHAAALDDGRVELELDSGALDDLLLDGVLVHQPVHVHGLHLADAVGAVDGLKVDLGVPVAVVENYHVGGGQVDAEPAGAGRQQEDADLAVGVVEGRNLVVAVLAGSVAVDAEARVAPHATVVLQNVEHASHQGKNQHARVRLEEAVQQLVHHVQLARVLDEVLAERVGVPVLPPLEEVGVVARLAQLHGQVLQLHLHDRGVAVVGAQLRNIAAEQVAVQPLLHGAQRNHQEQLVLGGHVGEHVLLRPPQHEGAQDLVEARNYAQVARLALLLRQLLGADEVELDLKLLRGGEDLGEEEVEQRPQLLQVVLQRRAGDQQAVLGPEHADDLAQLGLLVLDAMCLIDDDVVEVEPGERVLRLAADFVRRDDDVVLLRVQLVRDQPADAAAFLEVGHEADGLERFAETHLVREDAVHVAIVQSHQPPQPLQLVRLGRANQVGRLLADHGALLSVGEAHSGRAGVAAEALLALGQDVFDGVVFVKQQAQQASALLVGRRSGRLGRKSRRLLVVRRCVFALLHLANPLTHRRCNFEAGVRFGVVQRAWA
ncbi:NADH-quinone oxidoreductase subunit L [Babesia caballi]|uniref:NADH-quinone oxidoreductase subunit L n=1 Tax=Babesia caballi TaxID=5871 RepID=A0AAV4LTM1_BABCB|nr:NADH-quinone oxidoreductase subunit L [Babesia caballi]